MDQEKVNVVEKVKASTILKEVITVLGLVGFYPGFRKSSEPLYNFLEREKKFVWTTECEGALKQLNNKLLTSPILGYPNNRDDFTLTTYASLTGIGAILKQRQNGLDRVIAYASKTVKKSQRNYSATERELFGVVHFTNHFHTVSFGAKICYCKTPSGFGLFV